MRVFLLLLVAGVARGGWDVQPTDAPVRSGPVPCDVQANVQRADPAPRRDVLDTPIWSRSYGEAPAWHPLREVLAKGWTFPPETAAAYGLTPADLDAARASVRGVPVYTAPVYSQPVYSVPTYYSPRRVSAGFAVRGPFGGGVSAEACVGGT